MFSIFTFLLFSTFSFLGQTILDLGCGWGSVSLYLAEHYPKSVVYSLSNSATQKDYIMGQAASKGLKNLTVFTGDVSVFQREDWIQKFDRVISIGKVHSNFIAPSLSGSELPIRGAILENSLTL